MSNIEVTVLIAEYNTTWDKLKKSVDSVLRQQDIRLEILICDDGSDENWFSTLPDYFANKGFSDYKLLGSGDNLGTIKNVLKAEEYVKGRYIWPFGAGDYIHDEYVLRRWVDDCDANGAVASFGDYVSYAAMDGEDVPIKAKRIPHCLFLYKKSERNIRQELYAYLLSNDHICGAVWLTETKAFFRYSRMMEDKVIYADDDRFRLMLFDGITFLYHNEKVLFYEASVGVSTSNQDEWNRKLRKDHLETNRILCAMDISDMASGRAAKSDLLIETGFADDRSRDIAESAVYNATWDVAGSKNDRFRRRIQKYYQSTLSEERSKVRTLKLFIAFPEYIWLWIAEFLIKIR